MSTPLLTSDQVDTARKELALCEAEIAKWTARREKAARIVAIGEELQGINAEHPKPSPPRLFYGGGAEITPINPSVTLVEAVARILGEATTPLRPNEIRARLGSVGFTQQHSQNYFYTVISRLEKKGEIKRTHDKRYVAPRAGGQNMLLAPV